MADILPSINCAYKDTDAVMARVAEVVAIFDAANTPPAERFAHFDVADGAFTFHKSWDEPEKFIAVPPAFGFEAHLMVEDPVAAATRWLAAGAKNIIVHAEAATPEVFGEVVALTKAAGANIVLALNPETPAEAATPYLSLTSNFLVLAVHPGLSGQKFLPAVLAKIPVLQGLALHAIIEVDGGINLETGRAAIDAGANALVSGSDIFENSDPKKEYINLCNL